MALAAGLSALSITLLGMLERAGTGTIARFIRIGMRPFSNWLQWMIRRHRLKPLSIVNISRLLQPLMFENLIPILKFGDQRRQSTANETRHCHVHAH